MFDNRSEVLDALQVSVLFLSSSRVSVASSSNQGPSLLPSGPISRDRKRCTSCPLPVVFGLSLLSILLFFLYSVFNKGVLKAFVSSDVVCQLFNLLGSTFFSQLCPGSNHVEAAKH